MPGWGGFAELVAGFLLPKEGLAASLKRRQLAALRKAADNALAKRDLAEHARLVAEFERLSDAP